MTDLLLEWMSFRGSGKLGDADAELAADGPDSRVIADLVTLGHLDWAGPRMWRIAPPVLAGLPTAGDAAVAVLCGARTPKLLSCLQSAADSAGAVMGMEVHGNRPARIAVTGASAQTLAIVADRAGIPFQSDAALKMLACTPSIRSWPRTPCPMVQGRVETVRRFSRSRLNWVSTTLADATAARSGFFRIQRDWDWVSLLKSSEQDCAFIDDRAGRLVAAARSRVVRWSAHDRTLSLPAQLFPPTLIARGLMLCSGRLPTFDPASRHIRFTGVTTQLLGLTLALTGLRLT
jgi:hypothetical protein